MSVEASGPKRVATPTNSVGAYPSNRRAKNKDDEVLAKRDKHVRNYAARVKGVLSLFDTALEGWADYISFLSRLLKALQTKPSGFAEVPHSALVAKRLSQCLSPVLPSGVHSKALDVYAYIFEALGEKGLSRDLSLYLPGLTPVLSFASLSVKPTLLGLLETYVLVLDSNSLRPAFKAIILALLPGLEEESSEEFERTLRILDGLKNLSTQERLVDEERTGSVLQQYFWSCLFLASITNSSRRSGALGYLTRSLPRLGGPSHTASKSGSGENENAHQYAFQQAINVVASPEPGLLIRCFCAGLQDEQILTQRGFLDLLVTHLPLHSPVLQQKAAPGDLERLISAASSVVARREMSLNRRLWAWFLGPETGTGVEDGSAMVTDIPSSEGAITPSPDTAKVQIRYFKQYGLTALVESLCHAMATDSESPLERVRPLRVCQSLMDRWEIGVVVTPQIFLPILQSVFQYQSTKALRENKMEVLKSANMFFDGVESTLIWGEIFKLTENALGLETADIVRSCELLKFIDFITTNFNIREEEMLILHLPILSLVLLVRARTFLQGSDALVHLDRSEVVLWTLKIAHRLLELVPQRAFFGRSSQRESNGSGKIDSSLHKKQSLSIIARFYSENQGDMDIQNSPIPPFDLGQELLWSGLDLVAYMLRTASPVSTAERDTVVAVLGLLIRKVPKKDPPNLDNFLASLLDHTLQASPEDIPSIPFASVIAKVLALETVYTVPESRAWVSDGLVRQLIPSLVNGVWPYLSPSRLKHNVEAVRCIWRLQAITPDPKLVESTIASLMTTPEADVEGHFLGLEVAKRFGTLWTHSPITLSASHSRRSSIAHIKTDANSKGANVPDLSLLERPLMLLLDALEDSRSPLFAFVINWLQALQNLDLIVSTIISRLSKTYCVTTVLSTKSDNTTDDIEELDDSPHDTQLCLYYLQILLRIIEFSTDNVWSTFESSGGTDGQKIGVSMQSHLTSICLGLVAIQSSGIHDGNEELVRLKQAALSLVHQFLVGPLSQVVVEMDIENILLKELEVSIEKKEHLLQVSLMDAISSALKTRNFHGYSGTSWRPQKLVPTSSSSLSISTDAADQKATAAKNSQLPTKLLYCMTMGLTSSNSRPVLESWISFLGHCLPLYGTALFQVIIPIVECICDNLSSAFKNVQAIFEQPQSNTTEVFEPTLALLLNGLEQSLATAHERLMAEDVSTPFVKSPEQNQQGFFGNMVVGVFTSDSNRARTMTANNRLTVLLCFKDAVRVCYAIWSWGDSGPEALSPDASTSASLKYTSLRLRNRTRRIFEHLFAVEALESLETLVELWQKFMNERNGKRSHTILNLLQILEASRPKNTIPAIFNAMYSRTNPSALDPLRKSTLTSNLSDIALATFLVAYTRSLDDDAMDEIWNDCMTFLRDVLTNPLPHRQILPRLLEFTAVLGEKVDRTNFGDQRRMRRDLGDLFVRLLTATLTIRPIGFSSDATPTQQSERRTPDLGSTRGSFDNRNVTGSEGLVPVLATITPQLSKVLVDSDRMASTTATISSQVIGPTFRSKSFPDNVTQRTLDLIIALANIPEASKTWKRDVTEAFNDPRFFANSPSLINTGWLPLLQQWALADKERMPELLSRLPQPTAAGIMFGVGAASARLEADRKSQLNLRRIAFLILAAADDTFVINLTGLQEKLIDLLNATAASSPSSTTRAEVYMVIRALILKTSIIHLSSFWPTVNSELFYAFSSAFPDANEDLNILCLLQACKLLDMLLALGIDDFQMQEWLFITDTVDAVYRPADVSSVALVDELAEGLDSEAGASQSSILLNIASVGKRKPLLTSSVTKDVKRDDLMEKVLRPFFRQLSIHAFESTYSMKQPDRQVCFDDLMTDLFDDSTLV